MLQREPQTGSTQITSPKKDIPGLPARYSSARIGLGPPVRETAAWVAHVALPGRDAQRGGNTKFLTANRMPVWLSDLSNRP